MDINQILNMVWENVSAEIDRLADEVDFNKACKAKDREIFLSGVNPDAEYDMHGKQIPALLRMH